MIDLELYQGPSLGELCIIALQKFKDRVALKDGSRAITYRQFEVMIARAAARLEGLGVRKGDAVAQIAGNSIEVFSIWVACFIQGYRSVPLPAVASINDQTYAVKDSEAVVVIVDDEHVRNGIEIRSAVGGKLQVKSHQAGNGEIGPFWSDAIKPKLTLTTDVNPADVLMMAYTGGTTGVPKGVMVSSRSLVSDYMHQMAAYPWEREIKNLIASPITHAAGTTLVPVLLKGGCTILHENFDAGEVIRAIEEEGITMMMVVPTLLYALLDHPDISSANLKSMRRIHYGAAPISPTRLREALRVFGPVFIQGYGQTETRGVLTLSQEDHLTDDDKRLASAGMPYPGVCVSLLDDRCQPVPRGEIGEICVRGPGVMAGYWKKPDLTEEAICGGWLHTGDLAYQDEQGYYYIVDRKKDMVLSGGFAVFPKEVEDALTTHPSVATAAVIGIPDEQLGEAIKAFVVLRPGRKASPDELIAFATELKGPVKAPKSVEVVEVLPLTDVAKVDKKALRAPYWKGTTRRMNG